MMIAKDFIARIGIAVFLALVLCGMGAAQAKNTLVSGGLYRVHAGFLELSTGGRNVTVVKVDSATIYWDGKADKAAAKKDLGIGDEIIAEITEKDGVMVAKKVRFLHHGS